MYIYIYIFILWYGKLSYEIAKKFFFSFYFSVLRQFFFLDGIKVFLEDRRTIVEWFLINWWVDKEKEWRTMEMGEKSRGWTRKNIKIGANRRKQSRQKARQIATRKQMLARVLADASFLSLSFPSDRVLHRLIAKNAAYASRMKRNDRSWGSVSCTGTEYHFCHEAR